MPGNPQTAPQRQNSNENHRIKQQTTSSTKCKKEREKPSLKIIHRISTKLKSTIHKIHKRISVRKGRDIKIECACCFTTVLYSTMVQCTQGHLFCTPCLTTYAGTCLGDLNPRIGCMSPEVSCPAPFSRESLEMVLPEKSMELYDRLVCERAMHKAGLEVDECPFCAWKCALDENQRHFGGRLKVLVCRRKEGGCGVLSCRLCKRKDHRPMTCDEAAAEELDGRRTVEEAMSRAVVRNCPSCKTPFIKTNGCNKINCIKCKATSCYICRTIISSDYSHFWADSMGQRKYMSTEGRCYLFDPIEERADAMAKEAGEVAVKKILEKNPGMDERRVRGPLSKLEDARGYFYFW